MNEQTDNGQTQSVMPTLFLAHGSPMNVIQENRYTRDWQQLARPIPRPKAILCISAHWCTRGLRVTSADIQNTLHDFSGFPTQLYGVQYPCPGSPQLADQICQLLKEFTVVKDAERGLDHGSWGVLTSLFPHAKVPVVQLSLDLSLPAERHWYIAQKLAVLRSQGVLVIGSGNIVHNIPKWASNPNGPIDWAANFDRYILNAIKNADKDKLTNYHLCPEAAEAVPTPEHYYPLLYTLGCSEYDFGTENVAMSEYLHGCETQGYADLEEACMRSMRVG
jgi:4,5-DOPA dioxygenase extradiol